MKETKKKEGIRDDVEWVHLDRLLVYARREGKGWSCGELYGCKF